MVPVPLCPSIPAVVGRSTPLSTAALATLWRITCDLTATRVIPARSATRLHISDSAERLSALDPQSSC